jgi:ubiquinone/menaquinone biosynthesis C-methylase UbiE
MRPIVGICLKAAPIFKLIRKQRPLSRLYIFGILHHIPPWQQALKETARVLKPEGVLLLEEPLYRFTWPELEAGIREAGMEIVERKAWLFGYFQSYLCKVHKA